MKYIRSLPEVPPVEPRFLNGAGVPNTSQIRKFKILNYFYYYSKYKKGGWGILGSRPPTAIFSKRLFFPALLKRPVGSSKNLFSDLGTFFRLCSPILDDISDNILLFSICNEK